MRYLLALLILLTALHSDAMFRWKHSSNTHNRKLAAPFDHALLIHSSSPFRQIAEYKARSFGNEFGQHSYTGPRKGPGFGIASLASGIGAVAVGVVLLCLTTVPPVGFLIVGILAAAAVVCGAMGMKRDGRGVAIAGFWLGLSVFTLAIMAAALYVAALSF